MDVSRKLHINFQVTTFLGSATSPRCIQSIIIESMRTLEVPDRILGGVWNGGCPKDISRKLHINFQVSTFLGSAPSPSPMCLQSVITESKRTLEVPERSLGGFWDGGCPRDLSRKLHINFQVSTVMGSVTHLYEKFLELLCNSIYSRSDWV